MELSMAKGTREGGPWWHRRAGRRHANEREGRGGTMHRKANYCTLALNGIPSIFEFLIISLNIFHNCHLHYILIHNHSSQTPRAQTQQRTSCLSREAIVHMRKYQAASAEKAFDIDGCSLYETMFQDLE